MRLEIFTDTLDSASPQQFACRPGLQEGESEAFGNARGDNRSRSPHQCAKIGVFPDFKVDRQSVSPHPGHPVPVTGRIARAVRRLGHGQPLAAGEKHGQQDGFAQVFSPNGSFLRSWGGWKSGYGFTIHPGGISADRDGNIYVPDSGVDRIDVFDPYGNPLNSHEIPANKSIGHFGSKEIAVDSKGNISSVYSGKIN